MSKATDALTEELITIIQTADIPEADKAAAVRQATAVCFGTTDPGVILPVAAKDQVDHVARMKERGEVRKLA